MRMLAILLVGAVLLFGCAQAPGGQSSTPTPISDLTHEDIATPTVSATVTPLPSASATASAQATDSAAPTASATAKPAGTVTTTVVAGPQEFSVEMDDNGWYPSEITVRTDAPILLHVKERTENVYFAGAEVKNGPVPKTEFQVGESKDFTFTVSQSTCIGEYWPASGVFKGNLKVTVQGTGAAC